jgi:hypothetical protein
MDEGDDDEWRQRCRFGVNKSFQFAEQLRYLLGRRRDEYGIAWPTAADPVL